MSQRHPIQNDVVSLITTNIQRRKKIFEVSEYAREAIDVLYRVQILWPFFLYGFVIMPDHCHFLMQVPAPGSLSKIVGRYKMGVSHSLQIGPIWQPRFHMKTCSSPIDALCYIHLNPLRAGLSETPESYPWSSASGKWDVTPLDSW
jgi:putative transposase